MTNKNISYLTNLLAQKIVWDNVPSFNKAASFGEAYTILDSGIDKKIWGIGVSSENSSKILELFVGMKFNTSNLRKTLNKLNIGYRFIKTNGFKSYARVQSKPSIVSGNPAKHFKLNGWGTLGGYVSDNLSNYRLAISNNHVFGLSNSAKVNDKILYDTGAGIIAIGGFYKKIDLLLPPNINTIDAAVCWIRDDIQLKWGRKKPKSSLNPIVGMEVYKVGITTGYTEGFISNSSFRHRVRYPGLGTLNFGSSITILGKAGFPFSLPGDSGSLVFRKKTNEIVGIVFAGDGTYTFANIFKNVEAQLQISI